MGPLPERPEDGDGAPIDRDDDVFAGLDSPEQASGVVPEFSGCDLTHATSVAHLRHWGPE
jgi:hypothetical protein